MGANGADRRVRAPSRNPSPVRTGRTLEQSALERTNFRARLAKDPANAPPAELAAPLSFS